MDNPDASKNPRRSTSTYLVFVFTRLSSTTSKCLCAPKYRSPQRGIRFVFDSTRTVRKTQPSIWTKKVAKIRRKIRKNATNRSADDILAEYMLTERVRIATEEGRRCFRPRERQLTFTVIVLHRLENTCDHIICGRINCLSVVAIR